MSRAAPRPAGQYRHSATLTLNWADNDVYGHVNNAVHYRWFDTVINQWLIEHGLLGSADEPLGLVVETGCRYLQSVSYPGQVEVRIAIETIGRSSIRYVVGIFVGAECIAEGFFVHVYVDRETRRPVAIPDRWRDILGRLSLKE